MSRDGFERLVSHVRVTLTRCVYTSHTHARAHTHSLSHAHTAMRLQRHLSRWMRMVMGISLLMSLMIGGRSLAHTHAHTHTHTYVHTHTHTHTLSLSLFFEDTDTRRNTKRDIHKQHTHKHRNTHTCTHAQSVSLSLSLSYTHTHTQHRRTTTTTKHQSVYVVNSICGIQELLSCAHTHTHTHTHKTQLRNQVTWMPSHVPKNIVENPFLSLWEARW